MNIEVFEIFDVDKIIDYKVRGLPALLINGRIAFQKEIPDVVNIKSYILAMKNNPLSKKKINKILLPVDFSAASRNAYNYALQWSRLIGAEIKIVHCFAPAFDPNQPVIVQPFEENKLFVEERLKKFCNTYPNEEEVQPTNALKISSEAIMGFAVDEIIRTADDENSSMILMSTTSKHGVLDKFFGSISSAVSRKANTPVLLIPDGVSFKPFKNILYATNADSSDEYLVEEIIKFSELFKSNIHFVHVQENDETEDHIEEELFKTIFKERAATFAFNIAKIKNESVVQGINNYAEKERIDLIVFITRHRNFWENLMHKSMTKRMALNTKFPLLVLHIDN